MSQHHSLSYRPEIDGLRAVAVLAVLFYHAGLGFPGGYVGVDIFFVISGYLIFSLLLRDLEAGTFSLVEFWERRARRIIPALFVLAVVVLAVGWFILLPNDFSELGQSATAQVVFAANFFFWRTIDYFSGPADEMPLLHTWSLAVEEQFYLFLPLLLIFIYRFPKLRSRTMVSSLLWTIFFFSLLLSAWTVFKSPNATFYLLPTRAWELLAGSLLVLVPPSWFSGNSLLREGASLLGLAGILGAIFVYREGIPFPGLAALLPCIGAMLIIGSNRGNPGSLSGARRLTLVGKMLASRPLVFVGLISYSLYLWHWPVLAYSKYCLMGELPLSVRWAAVAVSLLLGFLSWRFVETPFRRRVLCGSRKSILIFAGAGLCLVFLMGAVVWQQKGFLNRFSPEIQALYTQTSGKFVWDDLKSIPMDSSYRRIIPFGVSTPGAPIEVLVWGDSHARRTLPALDLFCKKHGFAGRAITHAGTVPFFEYHVIAEGRLNEKAPAWSRAVAEYVKTNKIPHVVLVSRWEREIGVMDRGYMEHQLLQSISELQKVGTKVWVVIQVPAHKVDIPKLMVLSKLFHTDPSPGVGTPGEYRQLHELFFDLAARTSEHGAVFLDPSPYFLNHEGNAFVVMEDGKLLYADKHHITAWASENRLSKLFDDALTPAMCGGQEKPAKAGSKKP